VKTYENQNLHGLLDWRLGLSYWRAFCDPLWACGLDGDFSWGGLRDWPSQAEAAARLTLALWGGDPETDLICSERENGLRLVAFRLPMKGPVKLPWVVVRHPLWRSDLINGVLADKWCARGLPLRTGRHAWGTGAELGHLQPASSTRPMQAVDAIAGERPQTAQTATQLKRPSPEPAVEWVFRVHLSRA
jgi:hypothetical protein